MKTKTETKKSKSGNGTVSFYTTGPNMTRLVRDSWVGPDPKHALRLCKEGLGMDNTQALLLCSGVMQMTGDTREGDGTLLMVEDGTKTRNGMELTLAATVERFEGYYVEAMESIVLLESGQPIPRTLEEKIEALQDKIDELENDEPTALDYYKQNLTNTLEQLEALYPLFGKSMKDLPTDKVRTVSKMREQTTERGHRFSKPGSFFEKTTAYEKTKQPEQETAPKKVEEGLRHLGGYGAKYFIQHTTPEVCVEHGLRSGWLLPDGTFFGGRGIWIHRMIIEDLQAEGYFKTENKPDEDDVEDLGWVKFSDGKWYFWDHRNKITPAQVQFVIDYAIAFESSTVLLTDCLVHLSVFAQLLDGREFDPYELETISKPIIEEEEKKAKEAGEFTMPSIDKINHMDVLSSVFFQPDADFVKWLVAYAKGRIIIDIGAGSGYLCALIIQHKGKAMGIEPHFTIERKTFWMEYGFMFNVIADHAQHASFIKGLPPDKTLYVFARPCHNAFVTETINKVLPAGSEILYIGHQENASIDLGDTKFTRLNHKGTSPDNEIVLRIQK